MNRTRAIMPDESDKRNPTASNSSNLKKTPETAGYGDAHTSAALSTLPYNGHEPVLLEAVLQDLAPKSGQTFIDCTLGRGGHSLEIARRSGLQDKSWPWMPTREISNSPAIA